MTTDEIAEKPRTKGIHIGAPACFALELAIRPVVEAFHAYDSNDRRYGGGIYIVGSVLQRADWRDVDVRFIMDDETFAENFPDADERLFEFDTKWLLLTVCISKMLSEQTGLPIDFQFQPMTQANKYHRGPRNALGLRVKKRDDNDGDQADP